MIYIMLKIYIRIKMKNKNVKKRLKFDISNYLKNEKLSILILMI